MKRLWPDSSVDESSLAQSIFQLRKTLGEHHSNWQFIETIPKRGYRFSATVRVVPRDVLQMSCSEQHSDSGLKPLRSEVAAQSSWGSITSRAPAILQSRLTLLLIAVTVILAVSGGYVLRQRLHASKVSSSPSEIKTLAIMPFRPLDEASDDEQMRLGMADALVSRLTNWPNVNVRPSSATLNPILRQHSAAEAGKLLRVDAVLDGTIQRSDDRLRINVQLVRVSDGVVVWSEKFDERFNDILLLQDLISQKVATRLLGKLSEDTTTARSRRYTKQRGSLSAICQGPTLLESENRGGLPKGNRAFSSRHRNRSRLRAGLCRTG
jgi:TolB-like protein